MKFRTILEKIIKRQLPWATESLEEKLNERGLIHNKVVEELERLDESNRIVNKGCLTWNVKWYEKKISIAENDEKKKYYEQLKENHIERCTNSLDKFLNKILTTVIKHNQSQFYQDIKR